MKRTLTKLLTMVSLFTAVHAGAQTTLVAWNFPNNPDDAAADGGVAANATQTISSGGGTASPSFTVAGVTTNSISATGWNNGSGTKYWEVSFSAAGYSTITLSSKQRASNTGPAEFKVQYKIGSGGTYTDVTGGSITVADNWTSGVVNNLTLPAAANNQSSVFVRWIMTSNLSVNNGTVASGGTSRIDDILVQGSSTPLPLRLVLFEGKSTADGMYLSWSAACETGIRFYELEKSIDGNAYYTIGQQPAKNSGCGSDVSYEYTDATFKDNAAYRLKMHESIGTFSYSPVRYFRGGTTTNEVRIAPNPASNELHVEGLQADALWRITDSYGRVVSYGIAAQEAANISLSHLEGGMYFLQAAGAQPVRFVKQ